MSRQQPLINPRSSVSTWSLRLSWSRRLRLRLSMCRLTCINNYQDVAKEIFFLTFFLCGIRSPERFFPNQCKIIQELTDKSSNLLYCTFLRSLSYLTHKLLELPLLSKICLLFLTHLSLACLQQRKTFTEFQFWQRVQGLILKTCEGRLGPSTLTMLKV